MRSVAEWLASIPAEITPRDGLVYIAQALDDARAATDAIRSKYHGTLPPAPWPQHPQLVQAIEALEGGQRALTLAIGLGYGDRKEPRTGPHAVRLVNGGSALYREIGVMQQRERAGAINPETIPRKVIEAGASLLGKAAAPGFAGLVTFGAIMFVLSHLDDVDL